MDAKRVMEIVLGHIGPEPAPWERVYLEYHAKRYADTLALMGPGRGQRLLDVGSFPGHLAMCARELGYEVTALTGPAESAGSLELFRRRMDGLGIALGLADVERDHFPYPDGSYDLVLASEIIEHLPFNPYRLLRESFRVLGEGGRVLVSTPNLNRLQAILAMIADKSPWPDLRGRFKESFHSVLTSRHVREYSGPEIIYMLCGQNKEMYRFERPLLRYSTCLDPPFRWGRLVPWLLERWWPRMRSNQMVIAQRPPGLALVHPGELTAAEGLHQVESHPDGGGVAKALTTPFRWSGPRARLGLPPGAGAFQVYTLHLCDLGPEAMPARVWGLSVAGRPLPSLALAPDRAFSQLRLALPAELAGAYGFDLRLEGEPWTPGQEPEPYAWEYAKDDGRALGLVLGWDGFLRQDFPDRQALVAHAREAVAATSLEPPPLRWGQALGLDQRWTLLGGLWLLRAGLKPSFVMGRGDWRHLGAGWYHREQWPTGPARWSAGRAEAFLGAGAKPKARRLRLRASAGHPALGPGVSFGLSWSWSADGLTFDPPETPARFELPAQLWTDLVVETPPPPGPGAVLRVVIEVDAPRTPARLLEGSTDQRSLGLGLAGMGLEG